MTDQTCETCAHGRQAPGKAWRECRRHAPRPDRNHQRDKAFWPIVDIGDTCGEWVSESMLTAGRLLALQGAKQVLDKHAEQLRLARVGIPIRPEDQS